MEGNLWKWTNYFSGWQPRWFVLENGILSYYRSQEDVINGCKGSVKMSVCDVNVHVTDNTRLDLTIPGEAHFYVKAATPQERQEWLIALGSCKAGLNHSTPPSLSIGTGEVPDEQLKAKKSELRLYCDLLMQQVHSVKTAVKEKSSPDIQQLNEASSLLSATCDTFIKTLDECVSMVNYPVLMSPGSYSPGGRDTPNTPTRGSTFNRMLPHKNFSHRSTSVDSANNTYQSSDEDGIVRGFIPHQLRSLKVSTKHTGPHSSGSSDGSPQNSPRHSKRLENGTIMPLLPVTNGNNSSRTTSATTAGSRSLPVTPSNSLIMEDTLLASQESETSLDNDSKASHVVVGGDFNADSCRTTPTRDIASSSLNHKLSRDGDISGRSVGGSNEGQRTLVSGDMKSHPEDSVRDPIQTFFSAMESRFQDIQLFDDGGIPTTQFLTSCKEVLPIFDKLNPTAFAPIKMEFSGNVRKIQQKYSTDPDHFITIQNIVLFEVRKGQHLNANSATVALLWLKRGLEFIREFLLEYMTGLQDLNLASNNAYCRSLKAFHSYVLRGVFTLAAKSAPTREAFTQSLSNNPFHTKRANFEQILLRDLEAYVTANDVVLKIVNDFYTEYNLHSKEQM